MKNAPLPKISLLMQIGEEILQSYAPVTPYLSL